MVSYKLEAFIQVRSTLSMNFASQQPRQLPPQYQQPQQLTQQHSQQQGSSHLDKLKLATQYLDSNDPKTVTAGLNYLTQKSYESSAEWTAYSTAALQIDQYPPLLNSISSLLDVVNPLGNILFQHIGDDYHDYVLFSSNRFANFEWPKRLVSSSVKQFKVRRLG